jgi:hypothetical protein
MITGTIIALGISELIVMRVTEARLVRALPEMEPVTLHNAKMLYVLPGVSAISAGTTCKLDPLASGQ